MIAALGQARALHAQRIDDEVVIKPLPAGRPSTVIRIRSAVTQR